MMKSLSRVLLLFLSLSLPTFAVSILDYGAQPEDATKAFFKALTNHHVVIPAGTWIVKSRLTNLPDTVIEGVGSPTVYFDPPLPTHREWILGSNTQMSGLKMRAWIEVTNDCTVRDVELFDAYKGINGQNASNIRITNLVFHALRNPEGWGSGVHFSNCRNFVVDNVRGWDSDRGIEFEDGTVDGVVQNIAISDLNPLGKTFYSYGLDVHTHTSTLSCSNIVFQGAVLSNCFANLNCEGHVTHPASRITFKDVLIINPTFDGSQNAVRVGAAEDTVFNNIQMVGSVNDKNEMVLVFDNSQRVTFADCLFGPMDIPALSVAPGCSDVMVTNCAFSTADAVNAALDTTVVSTIAAPPAPHLNSPFEVLAGQRFATGRVTPGASLKFETSADLAAWTAASTNGSPSGLLVVPVSDDGSASRYFARLKE